MNDQTIIVVTPRPLSEAGHALLVEELARGRMTPTFVVAPLPLRTGSGDDAKDAFDKLVEAMKSTDWTSMTALKPQSLDVTLTASTYTRRHLNIWNTLGTALKSRRVRAIRKALVRHAKGRS